MGLKYCCERPATDATLSEFRALVSYFSFSTIQIFNR
jgi:hypothetical protein